MDLCELCLSVFIYLFLYTKAYCGESSENDPDVRMITSGDMYLVNAGDEIKLTCVFETQGFNLFDNPVMWLKTQRQESSQINFMRNIYEPFASTGRFTAAFTSTPPRYKLELTINDLRREDSGNYTCEVKGTGSKVIGEITHYIFVRAPVDGIYLTNTNESQYYVRKSLSYNEMEHGTLRCVTVGGYPPPEIKVFLGEKDITSTLNNSHSNRLSGEKGMRVMTYTTEVVTNSFLAKPNYNARTITCVSSVTGLSTNHTEATITVNYAPIIKCEDNTAYIGRRNVHVWCEVRARPGISAVFWVIDENGTTLTTGEVINEHWILVTDEGGGIIHTHLFMRYARASSFRKYMLMAENPVGISRAQVQLTQIFPTTPTPLLFTLVDRTTTQKDLPRYQEGFIYISNSISLYPSLFLLILVLTTQLSLTCFS